MAQMTSATGVTEADVVRWVGIVVAFLGTVVTAAPSTSAVIFENVKRGSAKLRQRLGRPLTTVRAMWARARSRHAESHQSRLTFNSALATDHVTGGGGAAWNETWTSDEKLERLHLLTFHILEQLDGFRQEFRDIRQQTDDDLKELLAADKSLEARIEEERRRAAEVDARGVPLIGIGILLSGFAAGLSQIAWLGWTLVGSSGLWVCVVLSRVLAGSRSGRRA